MVYSSADAVTLAQKNRTSRSFFAIGFETTTPPTAVAIKRQRPGLKNFSVLCCHVRPRRRFPASSNHRRCQ